jgi:hypothetical protein
MIFLANSLHMHDFKIPVAGEVQHLLLLAFQRSPSTNRFYLFARSAIGPVGLLPYGASEEPELGPAAPATARGAIEVLTHFYASSSFLGIGFHVFCLRLVN